MSHSVATLRRECTAISRTLGWTPAEFAEWLGRRYQVRSVDDLNFVAAGKCRALLQQTWDVQMEMNAKTFREQDADLDRPFIFGGKR